MLPGASGRGPREAVPAAERHVAADRAAIRAGAGRPTAAAALRSAYRCQRLRPRRLLRSRRRCRLHHRRRCRPKRRPRCPHRSLRRSQRRSIHRSQSRSIHQRWSRRLDPPASAPLGPLAPPSTPPPPPALPLPPPVRPDDPERPPDEPSWSPSMQEPRSKRRAGAQASERTRSLTDFSQLGLHGNSSKAERVGSRHPATTCAPDAERWKAVTKRDPEDRRDRGEHAEIARLERLHGGGFPDKPATLAAIQSTASSD